MEPNQRAGASAHESSQSSSFPASLSLKAAVEAMIFASREPLTISQITLTLGEEVHRSEVENVIKELAKEYEERYSQGAGGLMVRMVAGGYQIHTISQTSTLMEKMFSIKPRSISRAAQETLAIIAYREPVTRADIEYIRGVDVGSTLKKLLTQELIAAVGRKEDAGRPLLFATTAKFLKVYGLSSKSDLPPLSSFQPSRASIDAGQKLIDQHNTPPQQAPEANIHPV